jgi:hypothetical protein
MLMDGIDASSAAYDVGYESISQFSREYSRFFGLPPMRDVKALRAALCRHDGVTDCNILWAELRVRPKRIPTCESGQGWHEAASRLTHGPCPLSAAFSFTTGREFLSLGLTSENLFFAPVHCDSWLLPLSPALI